MSISFRKNPVLPVLRAAGLLSPEMSAATWASGYTVGSTLLQPNGETLFLDAAVGGGGDLRFDGGNAGAHIWEIQSGGSWAIGDTVDITGLALPIWSNNTNATNTTLDGTFTISFRSLGINNDYDTSDSTVFGTAQATYASQGTGVDLFYVNFDTPITWVADS